MDNKHYKYDFFISYKHGELDSEIALYLQQLLEQYKIPKDIQQKSKKKKISRVFRDESELSASSDLSKDISEQLANSEFLIVICSPDTKNSRWVDQEIRTFIKLRDRRNILPVLIKGEPEDSFPEILIETEPMAADFRSADKNLIKKRCRSELLRLVSPALYCSYDELKQRHKAYQLRRIAITASIITVFLTLFSAYSIYQNIQIKKNYEEKQINQFKLMADKSHQLLESGDRESAILVAMEALPEGSGDKKTPLVGDAMLSLESALSLYTLPDQEGYNAHRIMKMHDESNLMHSLDSDERVLVTYDYENTIYFWNLNSEELITTYSCDADIIQLDVYIGNNGLSYICHSKEIICFDYLNNKTKWSVDLSSENGTYYSFALSPEKDMIAAAGNTYHSDDTIENHNTVSWFFIDGETGSYLQKGQSSDFYKHSCQVRNLVWSPDNNTLCMEYTHLDNETKLAILDYATNSSQILSAFPQNDYAQTFCSFLDKDTLAYLWGSNGSISMNLVYTTTDYHVSAFNIRSGEKLWEVTDTASTRDSQPQIQTSVITDNENQDKQLVTVTSFSNVINILDGNIISKASYPNEIAGVFTFNRRQFHLTDDGTLHKINALNGAAFNEFYGNTNLGFDDVMVARSYSDSEIFVLRENSNNVYLLNQAHDESAVLLEDSKGIDVNATFSTSGKYVVGTLKDLDNNIITLHLWNSESGKLLFKTSQELEELELVPFAPGFIGEKYFYFATDERIHLYSLETQKQLAAFSMKDCDLGGDIINNLHITESDVPNIVAATSSGFIIQLTGENLDFALIASKDDLDHLFDPEGLSDTNYSYKTYLSPNGRYLAISRYNYLDANDICPIIVYDIEQQEVLDCPSVTLYPDTTLENLVFSEDSVQFMAYNSDHKLQIINLETEKELLSLDFAGSTYYSFWFSPDNRYLFLHNNDYLLKIYDTKTQTYIMNSDDVPFDIMEWEFMEDGKYLLIKSNTALSYPLCTFFYRTEEDTYEAFSTQNTCVDATLDYYMVDSDSTLTHIYKRSSLDDMIEKAKKYLNGRELTDLERQEFHIEN